jgi:hypothetical protein
VAARRHVGFDANDGLEAALSGVFVELDGARERAVVGDGDGGHTELFDTVEHAGDFLQAVEQAVMAVVVQVDEFARRHLRCYLCLDSASPLLIGLYFRP